MQLHNGCLFRRAFHCVSKGCVASCGNRDIMQQCPAFCQQQSTTECAGVETCFCGSQPGALSHRVSCGPFQLQLGGEQAVRSRSRGSRMSCLGRDEPDEEASPKSALEQRYSKVCTFPFRS